MISNKSSNNLYWILVLSYFYLIFSISSFSFEAWDTSDWWLFIFIVTFQISTLIAIRFIVYFSVQNSNRCVEYKLHLHKLLEHQKDNLGNVKKKWFDNVKKEFAKRMVWTLYALAHELNIDRFITDSEKILARVENNTFLGYLDENGFDRSSARKIKNKKWIKRIRKNYTRFLGYEQKFNYVERDYLNGSLIKSFTFSNVKVVINLLMFLIPFSISMYSLVVWDNSALYKLIITFGLLVINIIVAIPESKEAYDSFVQYWSDIEDALLDNDE